MNVSIHCDRHEEAVVAKYKILQDAIANDIPLSNVGIYMVLPSSFILGPRFMHQKMQDASAFVRNYSQPCLFITFTCNPNWPEIKNELLSHQTAKGRPDVLSSLQVKATETHRSSNA